MKTSKKVHQTILGLAGILTAVLSFNIPALYAEDASTEGGKQPRMERFFENHPKAAERMDANGNGSVEKVEFQHARKERREKFLENHPGIENKLDSNNDGQVGRQEWKRGQELRKDRDNNPPGPRGGAGTNWENRPGPQGGPGYGPNHGGNSYGRRDFDNNPPGPRGGQGSNWENKPGPQGGPGAGPNRSGGNLRAGNGQGGLRMGRNGDRPSKR